MLCDICKKREAKIFYTEIKNGEKREQHLCEECAAEHTPSFLINKASILSGLLLGASEIPKEPKKEVVCPVCGLSYEEFLKQGRFGCAECYHTFKPALQKLLKNLQGADYHCGKRLKGYLPARKEHNLSKIERLTLQLQQAIEKEEFEEAARLRDKIHAIKQESEISELSSKEGKQDG